MYVALYFEWMKKLIGFIEKLSDQFKSKDPD